MKDALGAVQTVLVLGGTSEIALATVRRLARDRCRRVVLAVRDTEAAAPDLVNAEVLHAFRRLVQIGALDGNRAGAAVGLLATMAVRRVGTTGLMSRVWALRDNLTAYDATYVALAEALACPLVTADRRLANAPGLRCAVDLV